jgi:hypothetical protein
LAFVLALAGCVPAPDFVGVRDASLDDSGGDDATIDATLLVPIEVRLRTRDGNATAVNEALIVAVDPSGSSRTARTDQMGIATIDIIPGGTLYAVQPRSPEDGHHLVALFDVRPGVGRIELGEGKRKHQAMHTVSFTSATAPNAIVYIAATSCGEQQASTPPVDVIIDDRCPAMYEVLYLAEGLNGIVGYIHRQNVSSTPMSLNLGGSFVPPVNATIFFDGFANMAVSAAFSAIGTTGARLAPRGFVVMGSAPSRSGQINIGSPTTGFLIESTITSGTRAQSIVIDGTIGVTTTATVSDALLAPFVGPAALAATRTVEWSQTAGEAQLLVVEGQSSVHPATGQPMLWRFILPATATPAFELPALPPELADFDLGTGETPTFTAQLFRFPSQITYADVMRTADNHISPRDFYVSPDLRPTAWTHPQ